MSGGIGEYLQSRGALNDQPPDDALDAGTIARIEALHSAVVEAEAERRFGRRRSHELAQAQQAEQAFLSERGFATYNDYRLRIRRSIIAVEARPAVVDEVAMTFSAAEEDPTAAEAALSLGDALGKAPSTPATPPTGVPPSEWPEDASVPAAPVEPWAVALRAGFEQYLAARVKNSEIRLGDARSEAV